MMLTEGISCTFCRKPQQNAQRLIESPDKHTHICDECIVELSKLKRKGDSGTVTSSLACSFCGKTHCFEGFYVPPLEETLAPICGECVGVCRKILKEEFKKQAPKS